VGAKRVGIILDLFDAFRRVDLVNNSNMLELIRLVPGLLPSASPIIAGRFRHISEIIFTMKFDRARRLEAWTFSVYVETFEPFFETRPELFEEIVGTERFQGSFAVICGSPALSIVSRFITLAGRLHCDVGKLIRPHAAQLLTVHRTAFIRFLQDSPDFCVDDSVFTKLVRAVLKRLATSIPDASPMVAVIRLLMRATHSLDDVNQFAGKVDDVIRELAQLANLDIHPVALTLSFLAALASRSEAFKSLLLGAIDKYGAAKSLLALKCRLLGRESDEFHVAVRALFARAKAPYQRPTTEASLQFLTELIEREWLANYQELAGEVFGKWFVTPGVTAEAFLGAVVKRIDADVLRRWIAGSFAAADVPPNPETAWLLGRMNNWVKAAPEIRGAILDGLGLAGERIEELTKSYGQMWTHLFPGARGREAKGNAAIKCHISIVPRWLTFIVCFSQEVRHCQAKWPHILTWTIRVIGMELFHTCIAHQKIQSTRSEGIGDLLDTQ
jgi:hypothetical protein